LYLAVARYTGESKRFTQLVWPLQGEDPDEAFSRVPYEKGFNFLYHLEGLVGTAQFEAFAKQYLDEFKFSTVSSGEFKDYFLSKFASVPAVAKLDWDAFFYGQGMPPMKTDFSNSLQDAAESLVKKWVAIDTSSSSPVGMGSNDIAGWDSQQTCIFLEGLTEHAKSSQPLTLQTLRALNKAYKFTSVVNSEIKFCWQRLSLMSEDKDIVPHVVAFITAQGRMKFVRPLYKALFNSVVGSSVARDTFIANSNMYHPICRKMLASDLGIDLANLRAPVAKKAEPVKSCCGCGKKNSETNYFPILAAVLGGAAIVAFSLMKKR
jgi:leukotriene-A4 hydrolase